MKLVKNMIYNSSYQILVLLVPLITVPYVSRVLSPEGIGINAYTSSIITYFSLIGGLGINLYGNREIAYVQDDQKKRSQIFFELVILKFISIFLALLVFLVVLTLFIHKWHIYYLLQSVTLIAAAFDISWYFMGVEDFRKIVLRNTFIKVLTVVFTFVLVKSKNDLGLYILLISLSTFVGNLTVWPFLRTELTKVSFKTFNILKHVSPAVALLLPQIAIQFYLSLNKTMLGLLGGNHGVIEAGYFDQSDKIVRIAFTIVAALGGAFLPRLSNMISNRQYKEAKNLTLKFLDLSLSLSFLLMAGIMGVSGTFATYFLGKGYETVSTLLFVQPLMIIFIAYSSVLGTQYLLAANRVRSFTISTICGLFVNLLFNILLIPQFGALGAVISTIVTEFATCVYQIWALRDVFKLKELLHGVWKYLIASIIVVIILRFLNTIWSASLLHYTIYGILGTVVYVIILIILRSPIINFSKESFLNYMKKRSE